MHRSTRRIWLWGLLVLPAWGMAATQLEIDQAWDKGVGWLMLNQHGDGGWSSTLIEGNVTRQGLGIQATSSAVLALAHLGLTAGYTSMGGVAWLGNAEPASVDALSRQVLALKTSGANLAAHGARLGGWRNARKVWGAYAHYEFAVMDTALGLRAMLDVNAAYADAGAAVCELLKSQHTSAPDFGWAHGVAVSATPPNQGTSAIAPTTEAVLALKRWSQANPTATSVSCSSKSYTFTTVLNNAVTWLLTKKQADNGFGDDGVSGVLESAQALSLLKAVAPTNAAATTTIDYLIARQGADGSWGGGDALQTAEVLLALSTASTVAAQRPTATVATDSDKDGIPDGVEIVLGTNPAVADSRFLADGAGSTVTLSAQQQVAALSLMSAPSASGLTTVTSADGTVRLGKSWDKSAEIELFVAGSATQRAALESALSQLFGHAMEVLHDDGGERGALHGNRHRAYYGTISGGGDASLTGKRLLVHFSAPGGSRSGVVALARGAPVARMTIGADCVDTGGAGRWSCPTEKTVGAVPEAGLSDVQPAWFARQGVDAAPLVTDELERLDARPVHRVGYAAAATHALLNAGVNDLGRALLARLLSGAERHDWSAVDPRLPTQPVLVCRLAPGVQPAVEALFLGTGCDDGALGMAREGTSASGPLDAPGILVVENETLEDVAGCLDRAQDGGSFDVRGHDVAVRPGTLAVGVLGTDRAAFPSERWGTLALDGVLPTRDNLEQGVYRDTAAVWMQWRRAAVNGLAAPSGERLALLQAVRAALADPGVLNETTGAWPLPAGTGTTSSEADVCAKTVPAAP